MVSSVLSSISTASVSSRQALIMCAVYIQYYATDFSSRFVLQEHLYVIWYWYVLILLVLLYKSWRFLLVWLVDRCVCFIWMKNLFCFYFNKDWPGWLNSLDRCQEVVLYFVDQLKWILKRWYCIEQKAVFTKLLQVDFLTLKW